jgi:nucleoside diphosphate kinase
MTDVYVDDCVEQFTWLDTDPSAFSRTHALVLLKPDAVVARRLLPAIEWLSHNGFLVVGAERVSLDRHVIRAVWQLPWRTATWQRRRLADLLATATDSLVLLVRNDASGAIPATVKLTRMKGSSDPGRREPGQLRHVLGAPSFLLNMAHTADEPSDVLRELAIHFDAENLRRVLRDALTGADRTDRAEQLAIELYAEFPQRCLDLTERTSDLLSEVDGLLARGTLEPGASAALRDVAGPVNGDLRSAVASLLLWAWRHGVELDLWNVVVVGSAVLPMSWETVELRRGVAWTG